MKLSLKYFKVHHWRYKYSRFNILIIYQLTAVTATHLVATNSIL